MNKCCLRGEVEPSLWTNKLYGLQFDCEWGLERQSNNKDLIATPLSRQPPLLEKESEIILGEGKISSQERQRKKEREREISGVDPLDFLSTIIIYWLNRWRDISGDNYVKEWTNSLEVESLVEEM